MRIPGLGLPPESRLLVVVGLVDSTGTGLFIAGSAVFFTRGAGLSITEVGIGLTIAGLAGLLALTPLGMLADRIGPRPAAVLLHFWRAAGMFAYGEFLVCEIRTVGTVRTTSRDQEDKVRLVIAVKDWK